MVYGTNSKYGRGEAGAFSFVCNRCVMKSGFYGFCTFCDRCKSATSLFSETCQGSNPSLSAIKNRLYGSGLYAKNGGNLDPKKNSWLYAKNGGNLDPKKNS